MAIAIRTENGTPAAYLKLMKPRTVLLHLVTAAAAMFLASAGLPKVSLWYVLLGGALTAGAANSLNCFFDRNLDRMMQRTRSRPLPAGNIKPRRALIFGIATAVLGLAVFGFLVSPETSVLAAAAGVYYVLIYTRWLKHSTRWSAVAGSGAGAFPPVIGWVAVTGGIQWPPVLLFALVALWSPPHFWSLTFFRSREYDGAGLRPMPARSLFWTFIFTALTVMATIVLIPVAGMGLIYSAAATIAGIGFLVFALRLLLHRDPLEARRLFLYSMFYLLILFSAIIADSFVRL